MRHCKLEQSNKRPQRTRMMRFAVTVFLCGLLLVRCSPSSEINAGNSEPAVRQFFSMDTLMRIEVYGKEAEAAADAAQALIEKYDSLWSALDENSDISKLNQSAGGPPIHVSDETFSLVEEALYQAAYTDGAFDPTVGYLLELWGFRHEISRVPNKDEINIALGGVDWTSVRMNDEDNTIQLTFSETKLDLGGIAKGYATDRLTELLEQYDIDRALINLGGNIGVIGQKVDGSPFKVAITDPSNPDRFIGVVFAKDITVITSGGYERFLEFDGVRYTHIMDPNSGYPVETNLASVSIVATAGGKGDALSTALMVMGLDHSIEFWERHPDFGVVLCTATGEIHCSSNLKGVFVPESDVEVTYFGAT